VKSTRGTMHYARCSDCWVGALESRPKGGLERKHAEDHAGMAVDLP